jgi:hypothetical protein
MTQSLPRVVVLADAENGNDSLFRHQLTALRLTYAIGVQSSTTVWFPGKRPLCGDTEKHPLSQCCILRELPVRRCFRKSVDVREPRPLLPRGSGRYASSVRTVCPSGEAWHRKCRCWSNGDVCHRAHEILEDDASRMKQFASIGPSCDDAVAHRTGLQEIEKRDWTQSL